MSKGWAKGSTRKWRLLRARVLERDLGICQLKLTGCTWHAHHVHHTTAWRGKPEDVDPSTLVSSCESCNLKSGDPSSTDPRPRPWNWDR